MQTRQILSVSLPPAMLRQLEAVRKRENRTRSELVREALRQYFAKRLPVVAPTKKELAAIRKAREKNRMTRKRLFR